MAVMCDCARKSTRSLSCSNEMTLGGLLDGGWSPERPRKDEKLRVSASRRSTRNSGAYRKLDSGRKPQKLYTHTSVHVNLQKDTHV